MDVSGLPVIMYALGTRHMTSLRCQALGGLDFELRQKYFVFGVFGRQNICPGLPLISACAPVVPHTGGPGPAQTTPMTHI